MAVKIAFIGAGSVGFTRKLVQDMLLVPELRDAEIALHDISERNLDLVSELLAKDVAANALPTRLSPTLDRRAALADADYVINCTRIGGLEAFITDIEIPLEYGVDQCVGDTLCVGGIMYGQRNIPAILDFCRDMRELASPDVLFMNYANPMAMNTWAALEHGGVNTVGLCHGVEGGWRQIADALTKLHGDDWPEPTIDAFGHPLPGHRQLLDIVCAGINHQTWYVKLIYRGRTVGVDELIEAFEKHPRFSQTEKVRIDVLKRFGCYSTESNGHLSEYLPWYRKRPDEIDRWIEMSHWSHGETGGYLRVCTEGRNWFETDFAKWLDQAGQPLSQWTRSSEHGSYIIEARETGRTYRGHFNVRNNGVISNLPGDCIVEAPGWVDRFGINMASGIELPPACAATCRASVDVQRMAVRAAVEADVALLKQAVLHDPLTAAILNPPQIWQLVDQMLIAQADWLPQYQVNGSIDAAKARLAEHEAAGTRVKTQPWPGAARIAPRSVEQLRADDDAKVLDADKTGAGQSSR
jgi:alpha-galactosidase